jgi:hypothetical protein
MFARISHLLIFGLPLLLAASLAAPSLGQQAPQDSQPAAAAANLDLNIRITLPLLRPPASPRPGSNWVPIEIDQNVPPVESGTACDLDAFLQKAGARIQEFVANVERFTATQSLLHESFNKAGEVSQKEQRKYDYMVSIEEIRPQLLGVEEFQSSRSSPLDFPGGIAAKGLPALVLIFHPYYAGNFSMQCEGLATVNGKPAWQLYFRQRKDKPNTIRAYKIGWNGPAFPVALKGRAWFAADTYQIESLQADLIDPIPDIRLSVDHTAIEYGPVHFSSRNVDIWLPQNAEVYCDLRGKKMHQRMTFSDYLLFSVDDKQKISAPKTDPKDL